MPIRVKTKIAAAASTRLHGASPSPGAGIGPIAEVPIGSLKPYPGNARTHDQRQVAKIARSLRAFGWMNPIIVDGGGVIIAGHGRWLAAKQLSMTVVPVVR